MKTNPCECGSIKFELLDEIEEDNSLMLRTFQCANCGKTFTDLYDTTYLGRTYKPELKTGNIVEFKNKKGK